MSRRTTSRSASALRSAVVLLALGATQCAADALGEGEAPDGSVVAEPDASGALETLNGCAAGDFDDFSATGDSRAIGIAVAGLTYTPKCMRIAAGQSVRWQGNLAAHPLRPGNPQDERAGSPGNPIPSVSSGREVVVDFSAPGLYPYYCALHSFGAGRGMAGVIEVR